MPGRRTGSGVGKYNTESPKQGSKRLTCQGRRITLPIWVWLIYDYIYRILIAGSLVVVNFSAEWCGTSRMIEDELTKLLRYHREVVFIMVGKTTKPGFDSRCAPSIFSEAIFLIIKGTLLNVQLSLLPLTLFLTVITSTVSEEKITCHLSSCQLTWPEIWVWGPPTFHTRPNLTFVQGTVHHIS